MARWILKDKQSCDESEWEAYRGCDEGSAVFHWRKGFSSCTQNRNNVASFSWKTSDKIFMKY